MGKYERIAIAGEGRVAFSSPVTVTNDAIGHGNSSTGFAREDLATMEIIAPLPGSESVISKFGW
ncbi:putative pre-mrna-splicing factor slt11 [Erysiphe neolycopersici]|uniref:Putative pre-mrna-splicing factor slt11 n=1 Tax=Erysiphe neolycopersici TaxID=212602 RepID=A0A420HFQ9_9PEZI|nr:putative pre-mrna-splicing factor slt11 [Erysiphe neolycopersici]